MRETLLDNGVRLVTEHIPGVRSVAAGVWVMQGSAHESDRVLGISHLLEHLVFKGTERRTAHEIALSLESLGGGLDAYTTREHTSYQARVLDEHLPDALDVLADLVLHPLLDPVDLELERDVVLEEIAGVEDTPDDLVFDLHGERLWNGHPYGHAILGTRETVGALNIDDARWLHAETYRGGSMLVGCAGNVEHEVVLEHVARLFESASDRGDRGRIDAPVGTATGQDVVHREAAQAHVVFGTRTPSHADPVRDALLLISSAFGGGMSSRLFQKIREELALAYAVFSYQSFYSRAGLAGVYVGTRPDAREQAVNTILEEYRLLQTHGLTPSELEQAKNQSKGQMILSMESTGARLHRAVGYALRDEPYRELEESLERIDAIRLEEVNEACARFYDPEDQYVLSLGP